VHPVLERLLLRHHLEPDPRASPGRIDDAVKADAELVLAHADGAPVVVPVVMAIRWRLEFVAKRGHPELRQRFRIRAVDHQLKPSSHNHSQRRAFSSFNEPGLTGSTQNSKSAGSRITWSDARRLAATDLLERDAAGVPAGQRGAIALNSNSGPPR
jgi:hypothetical protein